MPINMYSQAIENNIRRHLKPYLRLHPQQPGGKGGERMVDLRTAVTFRHTEIHNPIAPASYHPAARCLVSNFYKPDLRMVYTNFIH